MPENANAPEVKEGETWQPTPELIRDLKAMMSPVDTPTMDVAGWRAVLDHFTAEKDALIARLQAEVERWKNLDVEHWATKVADCLDCRALHSPVMGHRLCEQHADEIATDLACFYRHPVTDTPKNNGGMSCVYTYNGRNGGFALKLEVDLTCWSVLLPSKYVHAIAIGPLLVRWGWEYQPVTEHSDE